MTISRGQMNRQLYMGGGIMNAVPRENFFLGKVARAVTKPLKKAAKTVGKIAKSDIGKAALAGAAIYGLGGGFGLKPGGFAFKNLPGAGFFAKRTGPTSLFRSAQEVGLPGSRFGKFLSGAKSLITVGGIGSTAAKGAALVGLSGFLTSKFGMSPEQAEETIANPESRALYLRRYYENLNPDADEKEVEEFVAANVAEYMAEGGRIGFAEGPVLPPDTTQPVNPFGPKPGDFGIEEDIPIKTASYGYNEAMADTYDSYLEMKKKGLIPPTMDFDEFLQEVVPEMSNKRIKETRGLAALGGKMDTASDNAMQAAGIEGLPVRQNKAGVKELDLRETGGFIQPVGIKEKEDDIPAMLSNNEFVMTADAVRGMGGGDVNLGAQRMYDQMKMLEAGGKV